MKWTSTDLSFKLSITYGGKVNYYKIVYHPIPTLPKWKQGTPWQFSKQVCKLSFQLSVQIYFLLAQTVSLPGQTERERKAFFGRVQEGGQHCENILKSTWLSLDMKKSLLLLSLK